MARERKGADMSYHEYLRAIFSLTQGIILLEGCCRKMEKSCAVDNFERDG